jgi:hypothetical protein
MAQGDARAVLSPSRIRIGEQAELAVSVPLGEEVGWPAIGDTLTAQVEVVDDLGTDTLPAEGRLVRRWSLTSFDSGYWAIPPLHLRLGADSLETPALLLTVNTVAVDTAAAPRDIKDIYEVPFSLAYWLRAHWPWIAGGLGVLVAVILIVRRLRRRPPVPAAPVAPDVPLHERLLRELDAIAERRLWQQGMVKEHHSAVTDLLRGYVEERYGVPALERTTDELAAELRASAMSPQAQQLLNNLLTLADRVKFAKYGAVPAENEQVLASARTFILDTTPTDAPRS